MGCGSSKCCCPSNVVHPAKTKQVVVIDNGSGLIKAGIAGKGTQPVVFPSVIGRPMGVNVLPGTNGEFVGDEAMKRGNLKLEYPNDRGTSAKWESMVKIWTHAFNKLYPGGYSGVSVLMTLAPFSDDSYRKQMEKFMFDNFINMRALLLVNQEILPLYASGRKTGVVLDSGDGLTYAVPIIEGKVCSQAITRVDLAGRDLTEYLIRLLTDRGYSFQTSSEREMVRDMKEKLCYVALDFDQEKDKAESTLEKQFKRPDGEVLTIGNQRFRCPEALFDPTPLLGEGKKGVHKAIHSAIEKCPDNAVRHKLYENIVLSGGSTMFPGFVERLQREISRLAPGTKVKIVHSPKRSYSVWSGGSVLALSSDFKEKWITREE